MKKPRLLDLFSGAGGCGYGYHLAGFEVVGVDLVEQKNYPFEFHRADALEYLAVADLSQYTAIHASPPCQGYSRARHINKGKHPMLLEAVRERLTQIGLPWVIENVSEAPMPHFLTLCGTHFGLKVYRHRQFESSHFLFAPGPCQHPHELLPDYVCIYGDHVRGRQTGNTGNHYQRYPLAVGCAAMGIDWKVTQKELSQAIPPAYTKFIGLQLLSMLDLEKAS